MDMPSDRATESSGATPSWARCELIGSGSFGSVHKAISGNSGDFFAVKSAVVGLGGCSEDCCQRKNPSVEALENEIEILSELPHCPHIVKYLGNDTTLENGIEVRNLHMEYISGGNIFQFLRGEDKGCAALENQHGLPEGIVKTLLLDVVKALEHIHSHGIVHADVKVLNILLSSKNKNSWKEGVGWLGGLGDEEYLSAKLVDFGASFRVARLETRSPSSQANLAHGENDDDHEYEEHKERLCLHNDNNGMHCNVHGKMRKVNDVSPRGLRGTIFWMSPEVAREEEDVSTAIDIWSLGCTVIEMLTGRPPWVPVCSSSEQGHRSYTDALSVLYMIGCSEDLPHVPAGLSPSARDFISCCLKRNPVERWTATELLQHPFLCSPTATQLPCGISEVNPFYQNTFSSWKGPDDVETPPCGVETSQKPVIIRRIHDLRRQTRDFTEGMFSPLSPTCPFEYQAAMLSYASYSSGMGSSFPPKRRREEEDDTELEFASGESTTRGRKKTSKKVVDGEAEKRLLQGFMHLCDCSERYKLCEQSGVKGSKLLPEEFSWPVFALLPSADRDWIPVVSTRHQYVQKG